MTESRARADHLPSDASPGDRAAQALSDSGIQATTVRHGPVSSLAEAAAARGLSPDRVVKTIVVRRAADDLLFVLVPGDRVIAWGRLRELLGVSRLSLASRDEAVQGTGYVPGTITVFGSHRAWPVICDSRIASGVVSVGGGESGVAFTVPADELVAYCNAQIADVTDPAP